MPRYFYDYRLPATEHEFQVMLEELDRELGALGVPPPFRGLKAMGLVAQRCQIGLELPQPHGRSKSWWRQDKPPMDSVAFVELLFKWFEDRYGDRVLTDMSPGSVAVLIRGTTWELRIPLLFGEGFRVGCLPELRPPERRGHLVNVMESVVGMTETLSRSITDNEAMGLIIRFLGAQRATYAIDRMRRSLSGKSLVRFHAGHADLQAFVVATCGERPNYAVAAWHAREFAEKIVKGTADYLGVPYVNEHRELRRLADHIGIGAMDPQLWSAINRKPSIRYGDEEVTAHQAVLAQWGGIVLAYRAVSKIENAARFGQCSEAELNREES